MNFAEALSHEDLADIGTNNIGQLGVVRTTVTEPQSRLRLPSLAGHLTLKRAAMQCEKARVEKPSICCYGSKGCVKDKVCRFKAEACSNFREMAADFCEPDAKSRKKEHGLSLPSLLQR